VQQGGLSSRESPSNSSIPEYINSSSNNSTVYTSHYAAPPPALRGYNNGYESGSSSDTILKSGSAASTPLHLSSGGVGYSPPSAAALADYPEERRSGDARSTYLTDFELPRQQQHSHTAHSNNSKVHHHGSSSSVNHNSSRGSLDRDLMVTAPVDKDYTQGHSNSNTNNMLLQHERLAAIRLAAESAAAIDERMAAVSAVRSEDELSATGSSSTTSQSPQHRTRSSGGRRNTTTTTGRVGNK
jgi:hypothetical protein